MAHADSSYHTSRTCTHSSSCEDQVASTELGGVEAVPAHTDTHMAACRNNHTHMRPHKEVAAARNKHTQQPKPVGTFPRQHKDTQQQPQLCLCARHKPAALLLT